MSTKYEYYDSGDDAGFGVSQIDDWPCQSFTPATSFKIGSIKIYGRRTNTPGNITVHVQGVDGDGNPDGTDICSGTHDADTWDLTDGWHEITMSTSPTLSAGTQYAFVIKLVAAGSGSITVRYDNSSATFSGGNMMYTYDGGSNWYNRAGLEKEDDMLFELWGVEAWTAPTPTAENNMYTMRRLVAAAKSQIYYEDE